MKFSNNYLPVLCLFGIFFFNHDSSAFGSEFSIIATERTSPGLTSSKFEKSKRKAFRYLKEHKYLNAVEEFTNALQHGGGTYAFDLLLYRSSAYLHLNQINDARRDISHAIKISPKNHFGYIQRSTLYGILEENDKALKDLDHAILLNPNHADTYWRRGSALARLKKHSKALKDYASAIRLGETNPKIYQERGFALEMLGQYKDALFNYSHALNLDPHDYHGLLRRAWVHQCLGNFQNALQDFNEILIDNPDDADARLQRAYVYSKLQDFQLALLDFTFLANHRSLDEDVYLGLAYVHYRLGNIQSALKINKIVLKSKDLKSKTAGLFQMGLFFLSQGKVEDAKKEYEQGTILALKSLSLNALDEASKEMHNAYKTRREFTEKQHKQVWTILSEARAIIAPNASQDDRKCQKPIA